ncbi:MAG: hypothetical protein IJX25_00320 [Clostridia bacterium]|nr:hypothetical protein [Clostridia bacterium]
MRVNLNTFIFKREERTQATLLAEDGMILTQKELTQDEDRIYSTQIFLGKNDGADNYIEITELQAEEMKWLDEKRKEEEERGES